MKDIWTQEIVEEKKINKKKLCLVLIFGIIIVGIVAFAIIYCNNRTVRKWIDKNIFRKEVLQAKVNTIDLKDDVSANIYAYSRYIGLLNKSKFKIYNSSGNHEKDLDVQISNPIFDSSNRFLAIAENMGKKVYIVEDKDVAWQTEVEGDISQIHINKNGYVALVIVNTSHKSVVKLYDTNGELKFNLYLSKTRVVDVSISNDNKYLALAEVDTSGARIQSNIKIMSIEKASEDKENSLENTYTAKENKLITNIEYYDKNKLLCMYTDSINVIDNNFDNEILNIENKKIIAQSINLKGNVCMIEEQSSGIFNANSKVVIKNIDGKNEKEYIADAVTKEMYTKGDIIALNLGTEVEFINTGGWLVKKYIANQEITKIVISNNLAGIVYRDKIEIVNF